MVGEEEVENKFGLIVMYTRGLRRKTCWCWCSDGVERVLEGVVEKRIAVGGDQAAEDMSCEGICRL